MRHSPTISSASAHPHARQSQHSPPLRYFVDADRGIVFIDLLELRDHDAVIAALTSLPRDPAFSPEFHLYIDCSYLRSVPPADRLRALARKSLEASRPAINGSVAVVAIRPLANDAARFFALLTGAPRARFRVFGSWSEALVWLEPTASAGSWSRRADLIHDLAQRARLHNS
jgi:hypothetical protein